jgi:hypothetical protein
MLQCASCFPCISLFFLPHKDVGRVKTPALFFYALPREFWPTFCPTAEVAAYNIAEVPTTEGSRTRKRYPLSERQFGAALLAAQHGAVGGCKPERYHIQISSAAALLLSLLAFQPVLSFFGGALSIAVLPDFRAR